MSVLLSTLRAETEMAKAVYLACLARENAAIAAESKRTNKPVKVKAPNLYIMSQIRKYAAKQGITLSESEIRDRALQAAKK